MLMARFVYENALVGDWIPASEERNLYVNLEFREKVIGVQFKNTKHEKRGRS